MCAMRRSRFRSKPCYLKQTNGRDDVLPRIMPFSLGAYFKDTRERPSIFTLHYYYR